MRLGTVTKQSSEKTIRSIGYDEALDDLDEVTQVDACTVSPAGGLTATPMLVSGSRVRLLIEAGVEASSPYKITVRVSTAGGEVFEDELLVRIREI